MLTNEIFIQRLNNLALDVKPLSVYKVAEIIEPIEPIKEIIKR